MEMSRMTKRVRRESLSHEFVEDIPADLEEGKLYVSIRYRTAVHRCACGCGSKVVTPIKPARWHLSFDGDSVALQPSVGNWQFPCRSHYVIERDRERWAFPWTDEQVQLGRKRAASELRRYYAERGALPGADGGSAAPGRFQRRKGLASRTWRRLRGRR